MVKTKVCNAVSIDPEDLVLIIGANDGITFTVTLSKDESDTLMFQLDVAKQEIDKAKESRHEANIREGNQPAS